MGFNFPYILFGGSGAPKGGAHDLLSAHYTMDEVDAAIAALRPTWWHVIVLADDGPKVVRTSEPENPRAKMGPKISETGGGE